MYHIGRRGTNQMHVETSTGLHERASWTGTSRGVNLWTTKSSGLWTRI